ncbi:MAG TPA: aminotransferase class V-fold PLP-dependent enzyme, partial [Acidimicrobiales bacterium]|nr:aminotransferase class V-fold PLP-dependent enzyme [Acidimicrobiales bacterium]
EVTKARLADEATRICALRNEFAGRVLERVAPAIESGASETKVPGSFHVRIEGVDQEELLFLLDEMGVSASAGSACASGAIEPSHVLLAMGLSADDARSAVRFSLGYTTTSRDIELATDATAKAVEQLRV